MRRSLLLVVTEKMPLALQISGSSNKITGNTAILAVRPAGTLPVVQNEQPCETALRDRQNACLQSPRLYVLTAGSGSLFGFITCGAAVFSLRPAKSRSIT